VAEFQNEIVELKQKIERIREMSAMEERRLHEEINSMSNDLKKSLRVEEEHQRSFLMAQQELAAAREECQEMEIQLSNPLIRMLSKICSFIKRKQAKTTI
jgi:acetyl-CoA carboxylase alpha subunit